MRSVCSWYIYAHVYIYFTHTYKSLTVKGNKESSNRRIVGSDFPSVTISRRYGVNRDLYVSTR